MKSSSPADEEPVRSSVSSFLKMISAYNSNVLLAALVSLLLVVLFIFLLHFYARFFWSASDDSRRRRRRIILSAPMITGSFDGSALQMNNINMYTITASTSDKGLDSSAISSIPLFVYKEDEKEEDGLECAICLGLWEVGDVGRKLRKCGHGFHVECIDMWLSSHSTCPICRAPVLSSTEEEDNLKPDTGNEVDNDVNGVNGVGEEEVRVQVFPEDNGGDGFRADADDGDRRLSSCLLCRAPVLEAEDDLKPAVKDGDNGVINGVEEEEEVRLVIFSGGGSCRSERRSSSSSFGDCSSSSSSSVGSSLKRMLSRSRSERNKVFPSATNYDSPQE